MSFSLDFQYENTLLISRDAAEVFHFLSQYELALPQLFPGLNRFEKTGPGTYFWEFQPLEYGGKNLRVAFSTLFKEKESAIEITPQDPSADTLLSGRWTLEPRNSQCEVKMEFMLRFTVPLPRLTKPFLSSLASTELTKLFDRYATNLKNHFK